MKVSANPTHDAYVASWKDRVPADRHVNSLCGFRSVLHLFLNRNPQVKSAQKTLEIHASVTSGCNLELSFNLKDNVFMKIQDAVNLGNITLETVKQRLYPLFYTRMRLGEFDPPDMNPYSSLDLSSVQSQEHRDLAVEAAIKSFILLKNIVDTLPMDLQSIKGKKFGVIGPFADSAHELFGDYEPHPDPQYISTPRDGIAQLPVEVSFAAGCSDAKCKTYSSEEIKGLVETVDVTIVCLGTGYIGGLSTSLQNAVDKPLMPNMK
ncbi:unnamed protein product [Ranitomeya imitator]|uniref:Uncharacterized protein n=1 Tax=Ranitomeya imitator TaxID=111125 RepID=A0ABN9L8I3_9NEOB|nr:unnamed protein product [Ranitomeya imitator]